MIALPNIYVRNLVVSKDTVVTYTVDENRKIAIIFKQGEYYATMSEHLKKIVHVQDSNLNNMRLSIYELKKINSELNTSLIELEGKNKDLIKDVNKFIKKNSRWHTIAYGSMIVNIVLLIIIGLI